MDRDDVDAAFEMLFDALRLATEALKENINQLVRESKYEEVRRLTDLAERREAFCARLMELQREWHELESGPPRRRRGRPPKHAARLPRGERTPEEAFRRPILEALVELGGRAQVAKVLDLVRRKMANRLKPIDTAPLSSSPQTPRWRNTAQWARNNLCEEGLLRSDSPRGIWEITPAGRAALERMVKEGTK
jgi:hypothetical protein